MDKKLCFAIFLLLVVIGAGAYVAVKNQNQPIFDPLNATYSIDGQLVTLVNGKSDTEGATTIFGQPTTGDLNGDGRSDVALILVQNPGGSGTFYYVAAAINTTNGTRGTNAVLLGDRIAPQNIAIRNGQVIANYADRKPTDPMTTPPSIGTSMYLIFDGTSLRVASATN